LRVLTDETVAKSTVALLRDLGCDVKDVRESGMAGSTDEDVAAAAKSDRRLVVTHDKDFGDLLRFRPGLHCGAVVLRLRDMSPRCTNRVLKAFLETATEDYLLESLVILTEHGFRRRRLGSASQP